MNKILIIFGIFCSSIFLAQKSENFYAISYNSICCGTPSTAPVIDYIGKFQKKKNKAVEIFEQPGLGREGEFRLYIGIDALSKGRKKCFLKGLQKVVDNQNRNRNESRDGIVQFDSSEMVTKEKLSLIKNLTVYKKEK